MSNEELEIKELELKVRITTLGLKIKKLEISYRENKCILNAMVKELSKRGILYANDLRELVRIRKGEQISS